MEKKFLLVSLLLVLVAVIALKKGDPASWEVYQKKYFNNQIAELQDKLAQTQDQQKKLEIENQIKDWQGKKPEIINLVLPNGKVERCKTCHIGIEEISSSHPSDTFGCGVCHGGNPLSLDPKTAHAQMYGEGHPGAPAAISVSCGGSGPDGQSCHSGNQVKEKNEVDLVKTSIMSTKAGELSSIRRMLGLDKTNTIPGYTKGLPAQEFPDPLKGNPKEEPFKETCLNQCHQSGGLIPSFDVQGQQQTTGNSCEVCHILANPSHNYVGSDTAMEGKESGHGIVHTLTTQIPYTQCNQCHNVGQHDALNLKFTSRSDLDKVIRDWNGGEQTWNDRLSDYYLQGELFSRCEVSLDCIDCHTRADVMGDDHLYTSEYDAVHIKCMDCHGTTESLPKTKQITDKDDLAFEEQITNPKFPNLKIGDEILFTDKGEELPFLRFNDGQWTQFSRVNGQAFKIPLAYGSGCKQNPGEQGAESCHKCHNQGQPMP